MAGLELKADLTATDVGAYNKEEVNQQRVISGEPNSKEHHLSGVAQSGGLFYCTRYPMGGIAEMSIGTLNPSF